MNLKLTIELVPKTSWFTNLRSVLSTEQWDIVRKKTYKNANYKCEICGGKGNKHPVECHEEWEYDEINHIQKLKNLIALCPKCHQVKHMGFQLISGNYDNAFQHFLKINNLNKKEGQKLVDFAFSEYNRKSKMDWTLDIKKLYD